MRSRFISCESLEARMLMASDLTHTLASLSLPRQGILTATIGDNTFFVGGVRNPARGYTSGALDVYNAHTHRWYASTLPAGFPVGQAAGGTLLGKIFAAGNDLISTQAFPGASTDSVTIYDTVTGALTTHDLDHGSEAVAVAGTKVLFAAGYHLVTEIPLFDDEVDIYDASTGTWSTGTLSQPRVTTAATVDDQALFIGAQPFDEHGGIAVATTNIDVYNASTNAWAAASLSLPSTAFATAAVDHQLVIAGGTYGIPPYITFNGSQLPSPSVDIYHADTGTTTHATLSLARKDIASAVVGNTAVFAGGDYFTASGRTYPEANVDLYNAVTGQLTTAALSVPRTNAKSIVDGNTALFFGGVTVVGRARPTTVDVYNGQTGRFSVTTLPSLMPNASAVVAGDDVIFYTDGGDQVLNVYNVVKGTWSVDFLSGARSSVSVVSTGPQAIFAGGALNGTLNRLVDVYTAPAQASPDHAAMFADEKPAVWR